MAQNPKMAFLGFGTLSPSTQKFIAEVAAGFANFEVAGCFENVREAAVAVTTVVDRKVEPVPGSVMYVHENVDAPTVSAASNLVNIGVVVQTGWISWDEHFEGDKDAALQWLGRNTFPAKVDPLDALLFGNKDDAPAGDPLDALLSAAPAEPALPEAQAPEPAPAPESEPAPAYVPTPAPTAPEQPAVPADAAAIATPAPAVNIEPAHSFPTPPVTEGAGFQMPPAVAAPRNPLFPTAVAQQEGAAFLAPGPELAQASGPTQAVTPSFQSVSPREPREAVAEFQLPLAVALPPAVTLPMPSAPKWDEVIDPGRDTLNSPAPFPERLKFTPKGTAFLWTGAAGGTGKTLLSWTSANTLAAVFKRSGRDTPVYLVETDFGNPKLEGRLKIPASNTSIAYVKYLTWLESNGSVQDADYISRVEEKAIEEATWTDPGTGLRVIAAPYDTRSSTSENVQEAILQLSRKILSKDAVVFFDSGTVGRVDDKMLDRELAHLSSHLIIAASAGARDDKGKWVNASIDDMRRMAVTFSTSTEKGGWGLDRTKILGFFNKTDFDSFEERRYDADPVKIIGYLPLAPSMESNWIGDMQDDPAVDRAVAQVAKAIHEVVKFPELASFAEAPEPELVAAAPAKKPRRFGRKG